MQVACPHCNQVLEVPDPLAGQVARCGACSTLFTVPGPGADAPLPPPSYGVPSSQGETFGDVPGGWAKPPPPYQSVTYGKTYLERVNSRVGVVGGLFLALAILGLLISVLLFYVYAGIKAGTMDAPAEMYREFPEVFLISGVASLIAGALHLGAGIALLGRRLRARGWGIAAAVIGLCSLWNCCVWVPAIPIGVYALVVLIPNKPT